MKNCSYCGRENDDAACNCKECGTEFSKKQEGGLDSDAIQKPIRIPILARRIVSLSLGILFFLMVAPEFGWMPPFWIVFWIVLPLAPAFCVFLAAGRNLILEAIGWFFLIGTGFLFLVD